MAADRTSHTCSQPSLYRVLFYSLEDGVWLLLAKIRRGSRRPTQHCTPTHSLRWQKRRDRSGEAFRQGQTLVRLYKPLRVGCDRYPHCSPLTGPSRTESHRTCLGQWPQPCEAQLRCLLAYWTSYGQSCGAHAPHFGADLHRVVSEASFTPPHTYTCDHVHGYMRTLGS
jgi:hypothetical protein